ncbi:uncharacterized protein LOC142644177 [Castanea sativa]|uniref:uncharacterized protein LOC142644177 n=1 Tax=Castanea sativa TaxID=21020 RepID=UPI003F6511F2
MIQGFNQGGQRAIRKIRLQMLIGEMESSALFHIIDAKTTYKLLIGRPWFHEYGVVPSTYHQCLKYFQDGQVKKIVADDKPFTVAESHFADAKFYLEDDKIEETQVVASLSSKEERPHSKASRVNSPIREKETKQTETFIENRKHHTPEVTRVAPVLHYVPVAKRKEGQSPFSGDEESISKDLQGLNLPVTKIIKLKSSSQPLKGFTRPSQGPIFEHGTLPTKRTEEGFDPNAYRLVAKAGYNHEKPTSLGKLIPEASGKGQKTSKAQGVGATSSKAGIGYTPPTPIHIPIRKVSVLVISAEDKEEERSSKPSKKPSVFYRIGQPTPPISIFDRLGAQEDDNFVNGTRSSVLIRLSRSTSSQNGTRSSALTRLSYATSSQLSKDEKLRQKQNKISNFLHRDVDETLLMDQDSNEVHSSIPSRMKRRITKVESPIEDDAEDAPPTFEEGMQATVDELKEVNNGATKDHRPVFINANLSLEEEDAYVELLKEYRNVFAWTYKEMPGLDPKVVVHHLSVRHGVRPMKQAQRRFRPELISQIEGEVNKLLEVGFIREVKYPTWVSNIIPVRKKNGQIRVCVDFRDLNRACPKDEFPLPLTEIMVDATVGHEALSFMDGFSGYNQICMAPKDEELTAFRTLKGVYCYKVMPFRLKNAGATYQRGMQRIFDDLLHMNVECYVDDLVVKSKKRIEHLQDLRQVFERLRRYQLKMNPMKCAFGVTSGKFLGFIVRHR